MAVKKKGRIIAPSKLARTPAKAKADKELQQWLENYKAQTEARLRMATDAYELQDSETREVIDRIRDRITAATTGRVRASNGHVIRVDQELSDANVLFIATEIMKDLAMYDVKVANFEFPPSYCVQCREKLPQSRKKNRRRASR
jgi:hypothetical protein